MENKFREKFGSAEVKQKFVFFKSDKNFVKRSQILSTVDVNLWQSLIPVSVVEVPLKENVLFVKNR